MTLDGFLTFLGLAAAVYAIVPPVARLRIRLQLGVQVIIASIAVVLALYFEFFRFVALPCPTGLVGICGFMQMSPDGPFTPQMAAFIVVIIWMILAFIVATLLPPSRRSLLPMAVMVEQLFHQARYGEAVDFLLPHLGFVAKAQERKLLSQRVRDWLMSERVADYEAAISLDDKPRSFSSFRRWLAPLGRLFPTGHAAQENAERILNSIYLSRHFMDYVSSQRPSVTGQLLGLNVQQRYDFSDRLLGKLISSPGSRLYEELERNAKYQGLGNNLVVGHNFILRAYFSDAAVAAHLHAWKPVGDHVLSAIKNKGEDAARLLGPSSDFDRDRWQDPVATGLSYFDLMVRSAFSQNIEDPMWLAYVDLFVDELEQIYEIREAGIDTTAEFPIWASRLIYEAISALGHWVEYVRQAPQGSPHRRFPNSLHVGSESIPANAARSLGKCLHHVVTSDRIGDTFAKEMVECVIRRLRYLVQPEDREARAFLIKSIVSGGGRDKDAAYGSRLSDLVSAIDHSLMYDADDLIAAAQVAFPSYRFS